MHGESRPPSVPLRIGRYEILAPLGRGGMGVVYLARDGSLEREVAIKVLPEEVARDPERLAWFEREAKSLASLNHPNIATIHGFETSPEGTRFIVLERIAGETLAERLRRGPLSMRDSIRIGLQVADALGAAHERGIVHRDLKPGNVMVAPNGRLKLLDFGLAKRVHVRDSEGDIFGTPGYASPEQIRGEGVDVRADVFAFGCVLFETLAGRRAFGGETAAETIEATLHADPDWEALPIAIPPRLRSLLGRCLEKQAASRPDGMDAVSRLLAEFAGGSPSLETVALRAGFSGGPNNLPASLTRFIGREREVGQCLLLLRSARLLTLMGVAGCGKTRLALELADRTMAEYSDGIWFVDLAPLREGPRILDRIASVFGVKESAGAPLEAAVIATLREKRTLLLLDNCEHLVAEAAVLAQRLLNACAELAILATSREALELPGERIFPVDPLVGPEAGRGGAAEALRSESVQLFADRARLADPDFTVTDENAGAVSEICRRLDGIPLALELAAARLQLLSLEQVQSRLEDRFRLLAAPAKATTRHHRTLHAAIAWSHDQMADVERILFRRLAVFSGGWTLEAAAAVAGAGGDEFATLDLLTRLWNKSLVVVDRTSSPETRYRYLETIRDFALGSLEEAGEAEGIRDRHLEFYTGLAERTYPLLGGAALGGATERLAADHHNLLEALDWCRRGGGRDAHALRLASSLWSFWMIGGEYATGRRALAFVLDLPGTRERSSVRARALYGAGWLASLQGDGKAARSLMEESLGIGREIGDSKAVSRALSGLGVVALSEGDYDSAREYCTHSLEINRQLGNDKGVSAALTGLGNVAFRQKDFQAARSYMEEALARHRMRGDLEGVAGALSNLAEIHLCLGCQPEARRALLECIEVARGIDAKHIVAVALANAGKLAGTFDDAYRAARLIGAAEAIWTATGFGLPASDRQELEAEIRRLRSILGEGRLARARREGDGLSLDAALEEGLRYLGGSASDAVTR